MSLEVVLFFLLNFMFQVGASTENGREETNELLHSNNIIIKGKAHLGLDCDIANNLQFRHYSLLSIGECDNISNSFVKDDERKAQIIQRKEIVKLPVLHCSLRISLYTSYCSSDIFSGTRNWDSMPAVTDAEIRLTRSECASARTHNRLRYRDLLYFGSLEVIEIDVTDSGIVSGWKLLRGKKSPALGTCTADSFSIHNKHYASHTLTMHYIIKIREVQGTILFISIGFRRQNKFWEKEMDK